MRLSAQDLVTLFSRCNKKKFSLRCFYESTNNIYAQYYHYFEVFMPVTSITVKYSRPLFPLLWNYSRTILPLLWNYSRLLLPLLWDIYSRRSYYIRVRWYYYCEISTPVMSNVANFHSRCFDCQSLVWAVSIIDHLLKWEGGVNTPAIHQDQERLAG